MHISVSKILAQLTLFVLVVTFSGLAFAQGIIITPKRVTFNERDRTQEVLIANRGNEKTRYRISIVNRKMMPDGTLVAVEEETDGDRFANKVLRYGPRQVTLDPKGTQKIRLMSRVTSKSDDGEYRSHLLVQEIPDAKPAENAGNEAGGEVGINVTAIYGVTIPVIIRKGDLTQTAALKNPKITKVDGKTFLNVDIERTGNKSLFGTVKAFTGGDEIGILKNVAVYLSTTSRRVSLQLKPEYADTISGKPIRITFGAVESNEDAPDTEITFTP